MRQKRTLQLALVAAVGLVGVAGTAEAAPLKRVPRGLDPNEMVTVRNPAGQVVQVPRKNVLAHLDASARIRTKKGTLTVQEYFDRIIAIENKTGQPMRTLGHRAPLAPQTAKLIQTQRAVYQGDHAWFAQAAAGGYKPYRLPLGGIEALQPAEGPLEASWAGEYGDHDTFGAYASFDFVDSGSMSNVHCGANAAVGVWIFGQKEQIMAASLTDDATASGATGTATLNIVGMSPMTNTVSKASPFNFKKEWDLFSFEKEFPVWAGVISVQVKAGAHALVEVGITADGTPGASTRSCGATFTPHAALTANASGAIAFGIPDLVDIASGGVRVDLTLADIATPTSGSIAYTSAPLLTESLTSTLKADFMKGDLVGFVDIENPCWDVPFVGNVCALSFLGIDKSHYEWTLTDWSGFHYDTPIVNVSSRQVGFVPPKRVMAPDNGATPPPPPPPWKRLPITPPKPAGAR